MAHLPLGGKDEPADGFLARDQLASPAERIVDVGQRLGVDAAELLGAIGITDDLLLLEGVNDAAGGIDVDAAGVTEEHADRFQVDLGVAMDQRTAQVSRC